MAAINFFMAFATRTEAYEFDHVIGVICFNTEVKQILPLCESISQFKVSIKNLLEYFNIFNLSLFLRAVITSNLLVKLLYMMH